MSGQMLRRGSRGEEVRELQERLIELGYDCGPSGADADFGGRTDAAVRAFQRDSGLSDDGIVGPKTHAALDAATTPTTPTPTTTPGGAGPVDPGPGGRRVHLMLVTCASSRDEIGVEYDLRNLTNHDLFVAMAIEGQRTDGYGEPRVDRWAVELPAGDDGHFEMSFGRVAEGDYHVTIWSDVDSGYEVMAESAVFTSAGGGRHSFAVGSVEANQSTVTWTAHNVGNGAAYAGTGVDQITVTDENGTNVHAMSVGSPPQLVLVGTGYQASVSLPGFEPGTYQVTVVVDAGGDPSYGYDQFHIADYSTVDTGDDWTS